MSFIPCEEHSDFYGECLICRINELTAEVEQLQSDFTTAQQLVGHLDYLLTEEKSKNQRLRDALGYMFIVIDGGIAPDHPFTFRDARKLIKEGEVE